MTEARAALAKAEQDLKARKEVLAWTRHFRSISASRLKELAASAKRWANLSQWAVSVVGMIGALATPLRLATRKVSGLASTLESIRNGYDRELERIEQEEQVSRRTGSRSS